MIFSDMNGYLVEVNAAKPEQVGVCCLDTPLFFYACFVLSLANSFVMRLVGLVTALSVGDIVLGRGQPLML